ncbi:MAG: complex I subunit 5 family protein [Candidatus Izemoplasmatales bacterium]
MSERRKLKIFDSMFKANSLLVILSLIFLLFFIFYAQDIFDFKVTLDNNLGFKKLIDFLLQIPYIVLIIVFTPLVGGVFNLIFGEKNAVSRDKSLIYMSLLEIFFVIMVYPLIIEGDILLKVPNLFGFGILFKIDMLAYTVLLISAFIWFYVIIYAHEYMKKEEHRTRFFFFLSLTYSSVLGSIVSGDLLLMFIFFEIMTITSYMLIIHEQDNESYKAGFNYLVMGLIGGLLILTAILLLMYYVKDLRFVSLINELNNYGNLRYWIIGLLVLGFGIKAGMAPVHVWLPRAHPVAPTPASALLSGVLIKIGAYGILRVAISFYFPPTSNLDLTLFDSIRNVGTIIVWTGIFTMALGAFMALIQENIKKLLAYSSISQMGYILVGLGVSLYLGRDGAVGYAGAIYHIINHALFKSLLFMVAGVIFYHTKELNMHKLGSIWKKLPFTTIVFVIGMFGIIGMPLFNGYISKTIIHHSLTEAAHLNSQFYIAEVMYIIISAATVTYFLKMFYYVFLKKTDNQYKNLVFDLSSLDLALASISLLIIVIGLSPHFIINNLIFKQLTDIGYSIDNINLILEMNVFALKDLIMAIGIIIFGIMMFLITKKVKFLNLKLPKWLSLEYLFFYPGYLVMKNLCKIIYGDRCKFDGEEFAKLSETDLNEIGFIERFVITTNVLNRRYEQTIVKSDALIYAFFITITLIFFVINS